ncbi:MAG: PAS domain-containing protein [Anaerolineaceae bacterium]|nr:PAS domain-containing protein [Anaerolineaceae bacterium]
MMLSMQWQVLYILSIIVTLFLMITLQFYALRLRHVSEAGLFAAFMVPAICWSITVGIMALAPPETGHIWLNIKYFWIAITPVALLLFILRYTNRERWLNKKVIAALLLIPSLTQIVVWTNSQHSLMIRNLQFAQSGILTYTPPLTFGPYYWIHTGYSYFLTLLSIVLVVETLIRGSYLHRRQGIFLTAAILFPLVGNILLISGIAPREIDPMPFALLFTSLLLWWSVYRYYLLDLSPVARNIFVDIMPNGMLAIDGRGRIIDINRSMLEMMGARQEEVVGRPFTEVLKPWQEIVENFRDDIQLVTEITIRERQFDLQIRPLANQQGALQGRIILLHDISQRKKMAEEREQLIGSLQDALSQVKQLSGLLPICASCKKIRDDQGYWQDVAVYIRDHSEAEFSHGMCPDCAQDLYSQIAQKRKEKEGNAQ